MLLCGINVPEKQLKDDMDSLKYLEKIEDLSRALQLQSREKIQQYSERLNPADLAIFLQTLELSQQLLLMSALNNAAYVLEFLPLSEQVDIVKQLPQQASVEIISAMHADARTDLFKALPMPLQTFIFANLNRDIKRQIQSLSLHQEQTAGAIMTSDYVSLPPHLTMQQALQYLRKYAREMETLYLIYITNQMQQLEGVISLRQIVQSDTEQQIAAVMTRDVIYAKVDEDQESVAHKLSHYDFIALPIVDEQHHLLGIVTYDDAMDVIRDEYTEDFLKSGAVTSPHTLSLKSSPILFLYRQRVFWLVFLVFGSLLSGIAIAHFEEIIAAHIVLVFFLPLLVGSGGNAGSQSSTLMVRAIATGDVHATDWFRLLGRESMVALCLGGTMALAVSLLGYVRGDATVALVLALSMVGVVMMGCLIGMSLPFILNKLGLDPASASAPLVTSICDASGVLIYLFIASYLLF